MERENQVDGFISDAEAKKLEELSFEYSNGHIVEIGSYLGKSTIALARGSKAGGGSDIFAIDPHLDYQGLLGGSYSRKSREAFLRNISTSGYADIIRPISLKSHIALRCWECDIKLLFVDGDHRKRSVVDDICGWGKHLADESLLILHDADGRADAPTSVFKLFESGELNCTRTMSFEGLGIVINPFFSYDSIEKIQSI